MRAKYIVVGLIGVLVGIGLSSAIVVLAGNLDPPSRPTDAASQMYTLEQIYDRLDSGAAATKMKSFTEPTGGPGTVTMHTLDDIMGTAPEADNVNGALPAEVLSSKTFWGLRTGNLWGLQTGTAAQGDHVNGPEGARTFSIPDGFYAGKTATAIDTDLVAGNIRQAVTILGVTGTISPALVPRTGLTRTTVFGDDGDLEKGVVWPNPRFADNGNGTVTDKLTGLIWLKDANCDGAKSWSNGVSWAYGLQDGCGDCGGTDNDCGLNDGSKGGDWRMPNIRELHSLIHFGVYGPAVPNAAGTGRWTTDGDAFIGVESSRYWSSTTFEAPPGLSFCVSMSSGYVSAEAGVDKDYYVWPVKGGP